MTVDGCLRVCKEVSVIVCLFVCVRSSVFCRDICVFVCSLVRLFRARLFVCVFE